MIKKQLQTFYKIPVLIFVPIKVQHFTTKLYVIANSTYTRTLSHDFSVCEFQNMMNDGMQLASNTALKQYSILSALKALSFDIFSDLGSRGLCYISSVSLETGLTTGRLELEKEPCPAITHQGQKLKNAKWIMYWRNKVAPVEACVACLCVRQILVEKSKLMQAKMAKMLTKWIKMPPKLKIWGKKCLCVWFLFLIFITIFLLFFYQRK